MAKNKIKSGKVSGYTNKMSNAYGKPKKHSELAEAKSNTTAGEWGGDTPCALKYGTTAKGYKGFKP